MHFSFSLLRIKGVHVIYWYAQGMWYERLLQEPPLPLHMRREILVLKGN
jgi:hypothetical protein